MVNISCADGTDGGIEMRLVLFSQYACSSSSKEKVYICIDIYMVYCMAFRLVYTRNTVHLATCTFAKNFNLLLLFVYYVFRSKRALLRSSVLMQCIIIYIFLNLWALFVIFWLCYCFQRTTKNKLPRDEQPIANINQHQRDVFIMMHRDIMYIVCVFGCVLHQNNCI